MDDESERLREERRKDRLIQTRVPRDLESTLKREARRRRLTVSHLIRNILEDTFQLVDDVVANVDEIVTDSVELARRVGRDARRVADAVRDAVVEPETETEVTATGAPDEAPAGAAPAAESSDVTPDAPLPLAQVYAWNRVVANRAATCARCASELTRGSDAFVGLSDAANGPRLWLCAACGESL
jgi:hypothetical protein